MLRILKHYQCIISSLISYRLFRHDLIKRPSQASVHIAFASEFNQSLKKIGTDTFT